MVYLTRAPDVVYGLAAAVRGLLVRREVGLGARHVLVGARELQRVTHVEVM